MNKTTIIATWIAQPKWENGWPILHGAHQIPRPSVWLINPELTHRVVGHQYGRMLSDDELTRASRFHQPAHRIRYKTTHTALRMLLAGATQLNAETLRFSAGHQNKPTLSNAQQYSVTFNLSYTEGRSLIGVADGAAIGVDIEWSRRPIVIDDMLAACFSPNEIDYITARQHDMHYRFFTLWTRKEAILKLTGEGIGEHLPFFEVMDGTSFAEKKIIGGNPPDRVYLYSFHIGDGYVGCYATTESLDRLQVYQL